MLFCHWFYDDHWLALLNRALREHEQTGQGSPEDGQAFTAMDGHGQTFMIMDIDGFGYSIYLIESKNNISIYFTSYYKLINNAKAA